jgi:hypothetical protein
MMMFFVLCVVVIEEWEIEENEGKLRSKGNEKNKKWSE